KNKTKLEIDLSTLSSSCLSLSLSLSGCVSLCRRQTRSSLFLFFSLSLSRRQQTIVAHPSPLFLQSALKAVGQFALIAAAIAGSGYGAVHAASSRFKMEKVTILNCVPSPLALSSFSFPCSFAPRFSSHRDVFTQIIFSSVLPALLRCCL